MGTIHCRTMHFDPLCDRVRQDTTKALPTHVMGSSLGYFGSGSGLGYGFCLLGLHREAPVCVSYSNVVPICLDGKVLFSATKCADVALSLFFITWSHKSRHVSLLFCHMVAHVKTCESLCESLLSLFCHF